MKHMELLLRLQRMLDEETPDGGLEDLDELAAGLNDPADLGAESADLEGLSSMLEEAGGPESDAVEVTRGLGTEMEGIDDSLGVGDLFSDLEENEDRAGDLKRLDRLLKSSPGQRGGPAGGRGSFPRLERLFQTLQQFQDRGSGSADMSRLRRLMNSRPAAGGFGAFDAVDDPVVVRRRAQIKEFLDAWRAALKGARAAEARKATESRRPSATAATEAKAAAGSTEPAATFSPEPAAPAEPTVEKWPRRIVSSSKKEPDGVD